MHQPINRPLSLSSCSKHHLYKLFMVVNLLCQLRGENRIFFFIFFFILGSEAVTVHELDWQKKGLPSGKEMNLVIMLILNRVAKIQQINQDRIGFFSSISYTIIYIFLLNLSLPRTQTVLPTGFGFLFPLHQK